MKAKRTIIFFKSGRELEIFHNIDEKLKLEGTLCKCTNISGELIGVSIEAIDYSISSDCEVLRGKDFTNDKPNPSDLDIPIEAH